MPTVELYINGSFTCSPPAWRDVQDAIDYFEESGFHVIPSIGSGDPPEAIVQIQVTHGGFVPEGATTQYPEKHPDQYYLPGASQERTRMYCLARCKPPFDFERLRSWTKDQIVEWIEDGQYAEFVYDPPFDQPAIDKERRVVLIRPENRPDRDQKMNRFVPVLEWHATQEMYAADRRLKAKGHRNPGDRTALLHEMMDRAANPEVLDMFTDVIDKHFGRTGE